jgi:hypothetical protein
LIAAKSAWGCEVATLTAIFEISSVLIVLAALLAAYPRQRTRHANLAIEREKKYNGEKLSTRSLF